jgi:hypothetical protein
MPMPLPNATASRAGFRAGEMAKDHVKYPHLPRSIPVRMHGVTYPRLMRTGTRAPATKLPMGMTLPIMTKMGGHPADSGSILPPIGNC